MNEIVLDFFRFIPNNARNNHKLISSMQTLESSFFLLALGRFPHALLTCVTSIESAIRAGNIGAEKDTLQILIKKLQHGCKKVMDFPDLKLNDLRNKRNDITHSGYIPKDNIVSVGLYLDVALPLLKETYYCLHSFNLMDVLLQEYVELLNVSSEVYKIAIENQVDNISYCFNSFSHLIRWKFKENFSTRWEIDVLIHSDETGLVYDRIEREKEELEKQFNVSWFFDCPICNDLKSVVCELDDQELKTLNIVPKRIACVNCGFVVNESNFFLSEILLKKEILESKDHILKEYGLL